MKAVIDTNVLIYSFANRIDIESEIERVGISKIILPKSVFEELERIREKGGKDGRIAAFAIGYLKKLVEKGKMEVVETESKGDAAILEVAERCGCAVITNDYELRKRAKEKGIATGCVREKSKIILF